MNNPDDILPMNSENHEAEFIRLIKHRFGIIVYPKTRDLHHLILTVCHKFKCAPDECLQMLKICPDNSPLLEHLISGITIGETYFFRDKQQMELLRNNLLPQIIKKKQEQNNLSLRIWSAGCSTGEEIYTIAIMLSELLPDIKRWTIHLLGTDINSLALQKARCGRYNKWSMRSISDYHQQLYFTKCDNQYILSSKIQDMVDFQYLNLIDNTYPSILNSTNAQDLIICRNVLIYFNGEAIIRLMKKISQSLIDGGYLLLGASDPVLIEGTTLVFQPHHGMLFLRNDFKYNRLCTPSSACNNQLLIGASAKQIIPLAPSEQDIPVHHTAENLAVILCEKANKAANSGLLEQAFNYCQESLALDATNKDTYFILSLTLIEQNHLKDAEEALRKTLYLDRKFVEGHFQLGLLLLKNKEYKKGLKSLQNALSIVNMNKPWEIVPGSQGLSYQRFAEIINKEIELYIRVC